MLTIEWQDLGPGLGYEMPDVVDEAGLAPRYAACMARSAELHEVMTRICPAQAPYAVALAFRVRYSMQMNAREAMHMLELRSGEQGHPAYRTVAQDMHRLIAEHAGHRLIAEAMGFVDHGSYDLERIGAERKAEARRSAAVPT
jgi:thymidylate synthase ThyX